MREKWKLFRSQQEATDALMLLKKFIVNAFNVHFSLFFCTVISSQGRFFKDWKIQGLFELEVDDNCFESQSVNSKKNEEACFNDDSSSNYQKTWGCEI